MEYSTAIRCSTEYGAQTLAADEFIDIVEAMLTPNDLFNLLRNSTTEILSIEARN